MDYIGFVAGCVGGGAGIVVGQPFDTIKVRFQAEFGGCAKSYRGLTEAFFRIIKNESVFGLYKGTLSPLIGVSIQNAFLFGLQRTLLTRFDDSMASQFYAGTLSGAVLGIVTTPVEFPKIKLQMQNIDTIIKAKNSFSGPIHVLRHFYALEGIKGAMRGFNITILRDSYGYGAYFYLYMYLKEYFKEKRGRHSDFDVMLAGGIGGTIAWAIVYPLDVVKTRIQTDGFLPHGKYRNTFDAFQECYREGYKTFTRGMGICLIRAFPVNAITFYVVDVIEQYLKSDKR